MGYVGILPCSHPQTDKTREESFALPPQVCVSEVNERGPVYVFLYSTNIPYHNNLNRP